MPSLFGLFAFKLVGLISNIKGFRVRQGLLSSLNYVL
jgi:hypothetical protein